MSDRSSWMNEELRIFRRSVRRFVETELAPHEPRWRAQHRPDAEAWAAAGRAGMLLPGVPEEYGGGGGTLAHEIVVCEELARAGVHFGSGIQCIVARYILAYGSEAQKQRWLRRMASGELVGAIAMTEPGAGSDLSAIATTAATARPTSSTAPRPSSAMAGTPASSASRSRPTPRLRR